MSTTNLARGAGLAGVLCGGSANFIRRSSIHESRAGAQRSLRLVKISRRCVIAECRGETVGESWDESVTRTGWLGGRREVSEFARSL